MAGDERLGRVRFLHDHRMNTRRYHGLLTAATKPPAGRFVLLSKIEETLVVFDRRFDLSANQYPGTVHPQGCRYRTEFRLDPFSRGRV